MARATVRQTGLLPGGRTRAPQGTRLSRSEESHEDLSQPRAKPASQPCRLAAYPTLLAVLDLEPTTRRQALAAFAKALPRSHAQRRSSVRIPRLTFALCVAALGLLAGTAAAQQSSTARLLPSVVDWRHDIDEFVNDIRLLHPDPFTRTGKVTFLREVNALKAALPYLTDEQRVVRAMR